MADKLIEFFKIVDLINQVEKLEATQGTETTELQKVENTLVPQEYGPDEPISITSSLLAEETVSTMYSAESFDKLEVIFPVWSNSSAIQSECTIQLTAQWAQHRVAINELSEKVANEYKRRYREANGNMEVEKEILREGLFV